MYFDPPAAGPVMPTYREAYPHLSIVGARRAWRERKRLAEWYDERRELVGRLELLSWTGEALDLWYEWHEGATPRGQRVVLDVLHRPTVTRRTMPDAVCTGCGRLAASLYLRDGVLRCAGCHQLCARASLLTPKEQMLVKARRLREEVYGRDPPKHGFRTWDQKRLQLMVLKDKLEWLEITELREQVRPLVHIEWLSDAHHAQDAEALTALSYGAPNAPVPKVSPWFGDDPERI